MKSFLKNKNTERGKKNDDGKASPSPSEIKYKMSRYIYDQVFRNHDRKDCEAQRWTHIMCRLGRTRREQYEGRVWRGEKG
jgi:hypothetical protein